MDFFRFCFLVLALLIACFIGSDTHDDEGNVDMPSKLRHHLLEQSSYDKLTSPYHYRNVTDENEHTPIHIDMAMVILHVHSLDEINGVLTVNGWFYMTWEDPRLVWNSDDYNHISLLDFADRSIWVPDIMVYNNAESLEMDHYGNAIMKVSSHGNVYWFPPGTLKSTCPIDHKLYPFDEHVCIISMGAWAYADLEFNALDFHQDHHLDVLEKYGSENPVWEVLERGTSGKNISYSCCPGQTFLIIEVMVHLRRRSPFQKFMLTVPSLFAVFLTLAILWLPPDADVKFTLGATVLGIELALLIFLGFQIPAGGKSIPAIVFFCGNAFMLSALSLIVAVVVRKLCRKVTPVPENVLSILRGTTGTVLCLEPRSWEGWVHFISKVAHQKKQTEEDKQPLDVGGDSFQVEFGGSSVDPTNQSLESKGHPGHSDWYSVAVAIDRATFIIYCFLFFLVLFMSLV